MRPNVKLSLDQCCILEKLCDEYEDAFGVAVPDAVFFETCLHLGIEMMKEAVRKKILSNPEVANAE